MNTQLWDLTELASDLNQIYCVLTDMNEGNNGVSSQSIDHVARHLGIAVDQMRNLEAKITSAFQEAKDKHTQDLGDTIYALNAILIAVDQDDPKSEIEIRVKDLIESNDASLNIIEGEV